MQNIVPLGNRPRLRYFLSGLLYLHLFYFNLLQCGFVKIMQSRDDDDDDNDDDNSNF